jgi:outer membrane immunogenic protein
MKKFVIGALALTAMLAGPAIAADMPVKAVYKAPPLEPAYSWTGCYVGANAGGGAVEASLDPATPASANYGDLNNRFGWMGGGQVGCDYQLGAWVVGARGLFDWGQLHGTNVSGATGAMADTFITNFSTATGRIGYIFEPNVLAYVQGGGAWIKNNFVISNPGILETASTNWTGFDVGFGVERGFFVNWSIFAEFNYMNFGSKSFTFTPYAGALAVPDSVTAKESVETVLFGLNYRFNYGGPVVARY